MRTRPIGLARDGTCGYHLQAVCSAGPPAACAGGLQPPLDPPEILSN